MHCFMVAVSRVERGSSFGNVGIGTPLRRYPLPPEWAVAGRSS